MANLTDDQAQKIRIGLMSAFWREIQQPSIQNRAHEAIKALCLTLEERKAKGGQFKDLADGDLRAVIRECEWGLSAWHNELKVFDFNKAQDAELERQNGDEPQPANVEDLLRR